MIFGLLRLLFLAFLLYIGWTILKVLFRILGIFFQVRRAIKNAGGGNKVRNDAGLRNIEEMVKDPVCGSYVSTSHSISCDFRGERLYFCSQKCLHEYRLKAAP